MDLAQGEKVSMIDTLLDGRNLSHLLSVQHKPDEPALEDLMQSLRDQVEVSY